MGLSALTGCSGAAQTDGGMAGDGAASSGGSREGGSGTSPGGGTGVGEGGAPGSSGQGGTNGASSPGEGGAAGEGGAGGEPPACVAKNEATAGPYPNLAPLDRRDVRANTTGDTTPKAGAELVLRVRVMDLGALCAPIEGAVVDIWQCDAVGDYASYSPFNTVGQDFLRGYQKTDAQGVAELLTIFPGSYSGRALHIHFSIRASAGTLVQNASGPSQQDIFIAQLYFEQADAAAIFDAYPIYLQGAPITLNHFDGIYNISGNDLVVSLSESLTGYVGEVTIGVNRAAIGL